MKLFLALLLLAVCILTSAQPDRFTGRITTQFLLGDSFQKEIILNLPKHNIKPTDTAGTVIYSKITNTTNHSITLRPLKAPFSAYDSATLVQGLLSQLKRSANIDSTCIRLIEIVGHYIKSPYKQSFLPNFNEGTHDSLIAREYSLLGSDLALPSWHCDNFCKEAIYLLEATGYFSDDDFILQSCSIHTTMQVKLHNGDTVFADMTTGTPVFMVANPAKASGWASLADILNDTNLVNQQSQYYYVNANGDSISLSPFRSISNYKQIFSLPWTLKPYLASNRVLDNFNGDFILAPGQGIEYRYTTAYIIDTSQNGYGALINTAMKILADFGVAGRIDGDDDDIDSALYYLYQPYAQILGMPIEDATELFDNGKILLYSPDSKWTPGFLPQSSVLYNCIPPSADTLYFGRQTSAPLLVISNTDSSNGIVTESPRVSFYAGSLFSAAPTITYNQFNYANGIGMYKTILPNTAVKQTLQYNYNVLDFYTGGPMFMASDTGILIQASGDADTNLIAPVPTLNFSLPHPYDLPVNQVFNAPNRHIYLRNAGDSALTASIQNNNIEMYLWPNPTAGKLFVTCNQASGNLTLSLFDVNSKLLKQSVIAGTGDVIDLQNFANGIYFISITNSNGFVANKEVAVIHR